MEIISIRTKKVFAGPGVEAIEGEIQTWDEVNKKDLYIHCTFYDDVYLTVSYQSIMDYILDNEKEMPEIEFLEEYVGLTEAMVSNYIDGFILLYNLMNDMCDITYGHRESIYNYIVSPVEFEENDDLDCEEEVEGPIEAVLSARFMYQTKSMKTPVPRRATVRMTDGIVTLCRMADENDQVIESFDDEEAAARSKWLLLYQNMLEAVRGENGWF